MAYIQRTIEHPIIKDKVTFLKTAAETSGECSLLSVELAPGGGNPLHYHTRFSERFEAVTGRVGVQIGDQEQLLEPGQSALVPPNTPHRFFNPSERRITFAVDLRPGSAGFEAMLRMVYGLAVDGNVDAEGNLTVNLLQRAIAFHAGETFAPDTPLWRQRLLLGGLARLGRLLGQDRRLRKYIR